MNDLLDQSTEQPPIDNYFSELVGEGRKFKDQEDLAKGKYLSDSYIKILEGRLDQAAEETKRWKEEAGARANLTELIDKIGSQQQLTSSTPPQAKEVRETPTFDPKQIESLVDTRVQAIEASKRETDNFNLVREKLKERLGNNYAAALKSQLDDFGMSADEANALARRNPKVFIKTFGLDSEAKREGFQAPPGSSARSGFTPTAPKTKTWSYYQDLAKTNPELYKDRKTAIEMHNAAQELGESFFDGDAFASDKDLMSRVIR